LTLGRISTLALIKPAYSVETFCLAFDIGRSSVYEEIRTGRLKAHKVGTRTIIALEDGLAWLHGQPVVETMNPSLSPQGRSLEPPHQHTIAHGTERKRSPAGPVGASRPIPGSAIRPVPARPRAKGRRATPREAGDTAADIASSTLVKPCS
jgi:hypothetical protein